MNEVFRGQGTGTSGNSNFYVNSQLLVYNIMNRLPENFGHVNQQLKPGVIGAQVVMLTLDGTHFLPTVVKTMDRSPASFSGVSYGDVVLEIDGISTTNKKTIDIISLLRGEPDTNVSLKVWRGENKVKLITVKRKAFNLIY